MYCKASSRPMPYACLPSTAADVAAIAAVFNPMLQKRVTNAGCSDADADVDVFEAAASSHCC